MTLGVPWGVLGESLEVSLGDLGWSGEIAGGPKEWLRGSSGGPWRCFEVSRNHKQTTVFCVFSNEEHTGGSLRPLFLYFLIFDCIHDRFFNFRSYSRPFFVPEGVPERSKGALGRSLGVKENP